MLVDLVSITNLDSIYLSLNNFEFLQCWRISVIDLAGMAYSISFRSSSKRNILATPEMKFYYVKVDPGNGQILETQQVTQKELDKMHKEHSAMEASDSGSGSVGATGFPSIIPH